MVLSHYMLINWRKKMKLSNHTTSVLKNFATINQNLVIKEGNEMSTMSAMKNIVARATVEETFPKEIAIYDLNEFLGALSLFENPILDFSDSYVTITEENKPSTKMKYFYSDPSVVTSPSKMITMPSNEVKFTMSNDDLSKLKLCKLILVQEQSNILFHYSYFYNDLYF